MSVLIVIDRSMTSSGAYNTLLIKKNEPLEEQHKKITLQRANVN